MGCLMKMTFLKRKKRKERAAAGGKFENPGSKSSLKNPPKLLFSTVYHRWKRKNFPPAAGNAQQNPILRIILLL